MTSIQFNVTPFIIFAMYCVIAYRNIYVGTNNCQKLEQLQLLTAYIVLGYIISRMLAHNPEVIPKNHGLYYVAV